MTNRSITAIPGCVAGHATHDSGTTGVTAILFPEGATAGHTVPGHAPGSRELAALSPLHLTHSVHGICFAGGSVFGLSAADGVVRWLHKEGVGLDTGHARVPIVPAAVIYDLDNSETPPDSELGFRAAQSAGTQPLESGRIGAGTGASVGRITGTSCPGGVGNWAETTSLGTVAAVAVVNAVGCIRDPETGRWLGGKLPDGPVSFADLPLSSEARGHTTLVAVVTDIALNRPQATIISRMAAAGLARTHFPAHTPFDGDIVFTASPDREQRPVVDSPNRLAELGHTTAYVVSKAVVNAFI